MGIDALRDTLMKPVSTAADSSVIAESPSLLSHIVRAFAGLAASDRMDCDVDRAALASAGRMFSTLGVYASRLEPALLTDARKWYRAEAVARLDALDAASYLTQAEERLRAERERTQPYLPERTVADLTQIAEVELVAQHADACLSRGFVQLCDAARIEDLARMYRLLRRPAVARAEQMLSAFTDYARRRATAVVTVPPPAAPPAVPAANVGAGAAAASGPVRAAPAPAPALSPEALLDKAMVPGLLAFRESMERQVAQAYAANESFAQALKQALESAVNARGNKGAELLARHLDHLLRQGPRGLGVASDTEVCALLESTMALFRLVHAKDVFEAFYKKDLAKRLLHNRSSSADLERSVLAQLKAECGAGFTSKMEGMFKDVDGSTELAGQFDALRNETPASVRIPFDLTVHVLTSSYWPATTAAQVLLPPHLQAGLQQYEQFYQKRFNGARLLQWQHKEGYCTVRATFPAGKKELDVSFFQTLVLLMFNDRDTAPFLEIKAATGIEDTELRRTLQSLSLGQVRVLRKEPKTKDVGDADLFHFNGDFKAQLVKLKISTIQARETKQEIDETHEKVLQDRQYQIDACLVRIMKTRKQLSHAQLVAEALAQLRFPARIPDLKKRIESLIERDYLERDENDPNAYKYLA
jgi:cullin-4